MNGAIKYTATVFLIFLTWFALVESCKPAHNNNLTGGGKGGNGTISVTPEHGGPFLDSCAVYIKYATLDAPADGIYDDSVLAPLHYVNDTVPVAVFHNLRSGIYYFFSSGYHPGVSQPYVRGGKGFILNREDSENVVVPVYPYK
jgi:hypothetical protein